MFDQNPILSFIYSNAELKNKSAFHRKNSFSDKEAYLVIPQTGRFYREWPTLLRFENMMQELSIDHPINATLSLKYPEFADPDDDLNIAQVVLDLQDPKNGCSLQQIEMGLLKGRLFIGDSTDQTQIGKADLINGIQLKIAIVPTQDHKISIGLSALNEEGDSIAIFEVEQSLIAPNVIGGISPGAHFKSMSIEGVR